MEATIEKVGFQTYPDYKESGEGWLGEIPDHWEIRKLKHLFHEKKIRRNPDLKCGSISFGEVVYKDDEKIPLSTKASYQEVLEGEFLINPLNLNYDLISLRIALSKINVVVSSGYIVLKNSVKIDKDYYKFLLHRFDVAYMKLLGSGVRQTISFNHIADSLLVFPPLPEQKAIAEFLDKKTALIDKAIQIKEKQIALLQERRQILIQQAVTRGLDPNVPLKDSGVDWIGMIPKHWEVKRLKFLLSKAFSGGTPSTDKLDYWDGGIPWLSSVDIKSDYLSTTNRDISLKGLNNSSSKVAPKGSFVFVTRSGILQHTFAGSILERDMAVNQDIKCLIFKPSIAPEYFLQLIKGNNSRILLEVRQQAATVESIDMNNFFNLLVPVPDPEEQRSISKHVIFVSQKIDATIRLKSQEIEKLKEYKSTLINSAVTGKIKVI